jgi:hypothetical protein
MKILPLMAEITIGDSKPVVGPVERGQVKAPIEMVLLHSLRQALNVKHSLVELKPVRVDVVSLWCIGEGRGASVGGGRKPAVKLGARQVSLGIESSHQRISACVRLTNHRRTAVGPVRIRERRRIEWRGKTPASRRCSGRSRLRRGKPVVAIEVPEPSKEVTGMRGFRCIRKRRSLLTMRRNRQQHEATSE